MKHIPNLKINCNEDENIFGIDIISLNGLDKVKEYTNPFLHHRIEFYTILIVESGTVNHFVDFNIHTLRKGDSLIISKGQVHAFDPSAKYEGYLIVFTEEFLYKYIALPSVF